MFIKRRIFTSLLCFSFLLPVAQAQNCAIKIVSADDNYGAKYVYFPFKSEGVGNPTRIGSGALGSNSTAYAIVKGFWSVIAEPAIYTNAIYDMYKGGLSPLTYTTWVDMGDAPNPEIYQVPLNVSLNGNEIIFKTDNSKLIAQTNADKTNTMSIIVAANGSIYNSYATNIVGKSYASAHSGWCDGPASAGTIVTVVLRAKNYPEISEARVDFLSGVLAYLGVQVRNTNFDGATNTITFIETPYISVGTRVNEIDFLRVESGKSAVQPLDIELSSNVVSAGVTLTYEFRNIKNTARFSIKGLNGGLQEDVVTSSTKNAVLQISRDIEISEDDNTVIGPYEGVLNITATLP